MKSIKIRDDPMPQRLVLLRFGVNTLSDDRLEKSCEQSFAALGLYAFSVFGVLGRDYRALSQLVPIFVHRSKFLEAVAGEVVAAGFPVLPTNAEPHWSVVLPEPTRQHFATVRSLFRGPVENPLWVGPAE